MLQFKIFCKDKFFTSYEDYDQFPFDCLKFRFKFELCHFHLSKKVLSNSNYEIYRFNYLRTTGNEVRWKEDFDFLPELKVDF